LRDSEKNHRFSEGSILRYDFRRDAAVREKKVQDIKEAEFHETSGALLEKASYPLQVAKKTCFGIIDFGG
tara:strand:- start:642 stop:851 length:210 start_codon:yes stop_codon:yes gene_type:complete